MEKIKSIIFDCDDVLLDYRKGFLAVYPELKDHHMFHKEKNFAFRHSDDFANLEPCKFAVEVVNELKRLGYKLNIVTSVGNEEGVEQKRIENINKVFGENVFDKIVVLGYLKSKSDVLSEFPKSFFIDDIALNFVGSNHINIHMHLDADNSVPPEGISIATKVYDLREAFEFIVSYL